MYWVEEFTDYQFFVYEKDEDGITHSIPYHERSRPYVLALERGDLEYTDAISTGLFEEWIYKYTRIQRKMIKLRRYETTMQKKGLPPGWTDIVISPPSIPSPFVSLLAAQACAKAIPQPKEETTMNTQTEAERTRRIFLSHLESAYYTRKHDLEHEFHIVDDEPPHTFDEYVARLKAGKFVVKDKDRANDPDWFYHGDATRWMSWRDPKHTADKDGFKAACTALKAKQTELERQILVADLQTLPDLVKQFESHTIH